MQPHAAFLGPLGEGLGQQRQAGHQEQDTTVFAGHLLRDLEGGEGFARSAGHDELAPIGVLQSLADSINGVALVGPQFLAGLEHGFGRLVPAPIDLALFQVSQGDPGDGRLLVLQSLFGVGAPVVGGAHNQAVREGLLA